MTIWWREQWLAKRFLRRTSRSALATGLGAQADAKGFLVLYYEGGHLLLLMWSRQNAFTAGRGRRPFLRLRTFCGPVS